jgi:hypothetical protein
MIPKLAAHFAKLAEIRGRLERSNPIGYTYITSIENDAMIEHRAGVTVKAPLTVAAKMILGKTHRESTQEEIALYHADVAERTAACEATERLLRGDRGVLITNKLKSEIEKPPAA